MRPAFADTALGLLDGAGTSSRELADHAVNVCEQLVNHLGTLLGGAGVEVLLRRSVTLARVQFPWLGSGPDAALPLPAVRTAMAQQDLDSISRAFVAVLTAFVDLLERLIGEGLVERLLANVWPKTFSHAAKEIP